MFIDKTGSTSRRGTRGRSKAGHCSLPLNDAPTCASMLLLFMFGILLAQMTIQIEAKRAVISLTSVEALHP